MKEYSVYPGEYIPTEETEITMAKLKDTGRVPFAAPLMNMDEYDKDYKIEIGLPGAFREDINIDVLENVLSIIVLHKKKDTDKASTLQVHEFDNSFLERQISLPANADTEFIVAEYREGLLRLCVPKTNMPVKRNNHIAVY